MNFAFCILYSGVTMDITELIGIPLAALLRLCQDLLQNYGAAIVVFTLLT